MIKSPYRYPGGKSKKEVRQKILSRFPPSFAEYREPFCGGAGLYFSVNPSVVKKRWINDLNSGLIGVYKAFLGRPDEFIALCREIKPQLPGEATSTSRTTSSKDSKQYNARLKAKFDELKYNESCDQALRYFFTNRVVWNGRVNYDPNMESRMYFSNPTGWNITKGSRLEKVAEWIKGTKITCLDYSELLRAPGENVLIYMDPPYVVDTNLTKMSKLYEFGFSEEDHTKFAKEVKECKHKVCISYDDHRLVRKLFTEEDGFFLHKESWTYCGTSQKEKKIGQELIITNYEVDKKNNFLTANSHFDLFAQK